jgi:hypothetical protein
LVTFLFFVISLDKSIGRCIGTKTLWQRREETGRICESGVRRKDRKRTGKGWEREKVRDMEGR